MQRPRVLLPCRVALAACAAVALAAVAPHAAAADAPPPAAETESIESLTQRAQTEFKAGFFEESARLYLRAWRKSDKPSHVYNAARAYDEAGNTSEALNLYRLYVKTAQETDGTAQAQARIRQLEAVQAVHPAPARPPEPPVRTDDDLSPSRPAAGATSSRAKAVADSAPAPDDGVTRAQAWWVTGAAVAVLAGGTAMYVTGTAAADDANRMPRATSAEDASYRSAYRSATSRWQAGTALIGVGVLGAAVAVWLHVQVPASTQTTLAPLFTSQSVGLAWAGRW